jgi:hypothetical protein
MIKRILHFFVAVNLVCAQTVVIKHHVSGGGGIGTPINVSHNSITTAAATVTATLGLINGTGSAVTPTVGHAILVFTIGAQGAGSAYTFSGVPTDNQSGNTFTVIKKIDSLRDIVQIACVVLVNVGNPYIVTTNIAGGNNYLTQILWEVPGLGCTADGTDSLANSAVTTLNCYASSGFTTANASDMIVAGVAVENASASGLAGGTLGVTYTIPVGGVEQNGALYGSGGSEYYIASATSTFTAQFTQTNTRVGSCVSAAIH